MMKFASFEKIVEVLYKNAIFTPKDQFNKELQLGVSFVGGYVAVAHGEYTILLKV